MTLYVLCYCLPVAGIFKRGVDDITEETEHDQTVDTVSLSSNGKYLLVSTDRFVSISRLQCHHRQLR